ncbi:MAG: hypothetical protein ABT03_06720 [Comamonas sp. SCN 67-35]|nr:MAG: hypothetical protein ABT03_06720 [Comamonas sp. SCN 67-35]
MDDQRDMLIRNVFLDVIHQAFEKHPRFRQPVRTLFFFGANECITEISGGCCQTQQGHDLIATNGTKRHGEPEIDRKYIGMAGAQLPAPLVQPFGAIPHLADLRENTFQQCLGTRP